MGGSLTVEIHNTLNPLALSEWRALFPGHSSPDEVVRLLRENGRAGARLHSLVVLSDRKPVVLLPLIENSPSSHSGLEGLLTVAARETRRLVSGIFGFAVLNSGVLGPEDSLLGVSPECDSQTLAEARRLAASIFEIVASTMAICPIYGGELRQDERGTIAVENLAVS